MEWIRLRQDVFSAAMGSLRTDKRGRKTQWDGVLTGYDVADSAHVEDDQDRTVENWAAERDVGPLEDREEALTRLNLCSINISISNRCP